MAIFFMATLFVLPGATKENNAVNYFIFFHYWLHEHAIPLEG